MKNKLILALLLTVAASIVYAKDNVTIVAPTSVAAEGLNLQAVSELFTETANLEAFEQALNHPDEGINNLDLDGNGEVDFIRVVEQVIDDSHLIILQAAIGADEFQDVATIEIEKSADSYAMQVRGDEIIYGTNYYYAPPAHVHIAAWPIIAWIYRPVYRPYHSRFHFGLYPRWWRPFRPLHRNVYHNRIVRFTKSNRFVIGHKSRLRSIHRFNYKPHRSVRVTKRVHVNKNKRGGKTTTVTRGVKKTTNHRTGKTTVKKGVKKTTKTKNGRKTTVKKTKVTKRKRKN